MTTKERLHALIEQLSPHDEAEALAYLEWLLSPEEVLSEDELAEVQRGEAEIAAGEFVTLDDLKRAHAS
jgi:predicted transcriptional regulator